MTPTFTHLGTVVEPIPGTARRVAGGRCVDVRVKDPRSTLTSATVNVDNIIDQDGRRYSPEIG